MRRCLFLLACVVLGCAERRVVILPDPPRRSPVAALLATHPLAAGQHIQPTEIGRGAHGSVSLIQIRDREAPHRHARYDITVVLVRGHGVLWLDRAPLAMRTGDVAFVPRGTPHWFVNEDDAPAAALVSFAPAFSGPDAEPVTAP